MQVQVYLPCCLFADSYEKELYYLARFSVSQVSLTDKERGAELHLPSRCWLSYGSNIPVLLMVLIHILSFLQISDAGFVWFPGKLW